MQAICIAAGGEVEIGQICQGTVCTGIQPLTTDVPTLSEWGLIAMTGILGIVGFMVIRRRKATA